MVAKFAMRTKTLVAEHQLIIVESVESTLHMPEPLSTTRAATSSSMLNLKKGDLQLKFSFFPPNFSIAKYRNSESVYC